jgi:hypothetical protein
VRPYRAIARNYILATRKDFEPGIVVMMDGGLGSQMWQYSIGRLAAMKSGLPVCYDLSWFDRDGRDINKKFSRAYRLESVFPNVQVKRADENTSRMYRNYFNLYPGTRFRYDERIVAAREAKYLGGYYVNAHYIDQQGDALRDELTFGIRLSEENETLLSLIASASNAVAIHIRRGDYIGSVHDVTTPRYFTEAVRYVAKKLYPERAVFFVFSNGMEWSREILAGVDEKFVFVENNDNDSGEADMFLMSRCAHFIISNSSFSWWPAWLSRRSPGKIVVMPDVWLTWERAVDKLSMAAAGWVALPR